MRPIQREAAHFKLAWFHRKLTPLSIQCRLVAFRGAMLVLARPQALRQACCG
jgi:hypothetical protein